MTSRWAAWLAAGLAAACAPLSAERSRMDLSGEWRFRLDPDQVGIDAGWYAAPLEQAGKIRVPGCWEAQGYGEATAEAKHSFVGWGWYQRSFVAPGTWQAWRVFLHIGGVHRTASVSLNGLAIGDHVGYVTAARFEVTDALRFGGRNLLTIRVDSEQHPESDGLAGCFDTYDFIKWGGIFRDVWLEVVGSAWLDNLFVRSEGGASRARITADVRGAAAEAPGLHVRCRLEPIGGGSTYQTGAPVTVTRAAQAVDVVVPTPGAKLWSPEHPHLYRATLELCQGDEVLDSVSTRCGLREIDIRGNDIYLNGQRILLRGYGDDCCFPLTVCPPADKGFYIERFRVARDYGFTYVRHHSHVPLQEYFDAADEMGFLVQPELPIAYENHIRDATPGARELLRSQWRDIILQYRNHPSVFCWCMGNELWQSFDMAPELYATAKALDPTRPVCDTDGLSGGPGHASWSRETLDIAHVQFNEHTIPWRRDVRKYELPGAPIKPVTIHEMGNFAAFQDVRDAALYGGLAKPSWLVSRQATDPIDYRSHRHEHARMWYVRQMGDPWAVEWETAPVPAAETGRVAFVWTAATGFITEPEGTFALYVDGRRLITFGCPEESQSVWRSENGQSELVFDVRETGIDQFGVMYLLLPTGMVSAKRSVRLKVTGSPSDSRRWFGIYDYTDTLEYETRAGALGRAPSDATLTEGFRRLVRWSNAEQASVSAVARARGTTRLLPMFVENSRRLQALCRKLNMEAARCSPEIDGYSLWLLQDYWKGGQGLLNQFYQPKGLSADEARQVNGPTVVLLRRERCAVCVGEPITGTAVVSHFGEDILAEPTLEAALAEVSDRQQSPQLITRRQWDLDPIPCGTVQGVADIRLRTPRRSRPTKVRLELTLADGARRWQNQWDFWLFPRPRPLEHPAQIGLVGGAAYADIYPLARQLDPGQTAPGDVRLLVVGALTRGVLDQLDAGQAVLLLAPGAFAGDRLAFKSPWWFSRPADSNLGTIVRTHPALGDFPHEGWCDLHWFDVIEGSVAVHHAGELARVTPIIQAIDLPLRQLTRSLLFEARVGEGRLLSCSLNLTADMARNGPAARHLLDGLIRYAGSDDFRPKVRLAPDDLVACLAERTTMHTAVLEGFTAQRSAAADPHSGQTPTKPAREVGYRGEATNTWIVRQRDPGRFVTWATAAAPEDFSADAATFQWAGTLGWISEPEGQFTLLVDDQPVLSFHVTDQAWTCRSADEQVSLRFEPVFRRGEDTHGIFRLTVPQARLRAGQPLTLTVRGSGGSRRWFGLQEYTDTVGWELRLR